MNWYQLIKFAQVRGEFWLDDSGYAQEASGDGDYNHEGYVMATILGKYDLDWENGGVYLQTSQGLEEFIDSRWQDIVEYAVTQGWINQQQAYEATNNPQAELSPGKPYREAIIYEFTPRDAVMMEGGTPEEAEVASVTGDARLFAQKNWGWTRVEGNNLETWDVDHSSLKNIADGLYSAYGDDVDSTKFTLFLHKTKQWYQDLPFDTFQEGNMLFMRRNQFLGWG